MRPVQTESTDVELVLPGADDRNLPAQRILAFDPELGETPAEAHSVTLTVWMPEEGERKALVNGAPLELFFHLPPEAHPPVSLKVGNPDPEQLEALLAKAHVDRAVGFWFTAIAKKLAETGSMGTAPEVLELWHEALEETREGAAEVDLGQRINETLETIPEAEK